MSAQPHVSNKEEAFHSLNGRQFRRILSESDILAFVRSIRQGNPAIATHLPGQDAELFRKTKKRIHGNPERIHYWGIFEDPSESTGNLIDVEREVEKVAILDEGLTVPTTGLVSGGCYINAEMNLFGRKRKIGGLSAVGTNILNKKRGLANDLVLHYLLECDRKGQAIATLHPFRPDFYYQLGFGYSSPNYEYFIKPSSFPKLTGASEGKVVEILEKDFEDMFDFLTRFADSQHGCIYMDKVDAKKFVTGVKGLIYAYRDAQGSIQGYIQFDFRKEGLEGYNPNDMLVSQFYSLTVEAMRGLMNFMRTQDDMIRYVRLRTHDPDIPFLLGDPRTADNVYQPTSRCGLKSSNRGICLMIRIVNVETLFSSYLSDHNFNNATITLLVDVEDKKRAVNNRAFLVSFDKGVSSVIAIGDDAASRSCDAALRISIQNLTSVVVGSITLRSLVRKGMAVLEPLSALANVSRVFEVDNMPVNIMEF
ncbi:hypothetical protein HDU97_009308 [Phlyctochytrium planicorne]|nr:hypothetical protein HDU97_009308 [Phlyctochytrium planicorne]